jgi:hypothetical protein
MNRMIYLKFDHIASSVLSKYRVHRCSISACAHQQRGWGNTRTHAHTIHTRARARNAQHRGGENTKSTTLYAHTTLTCTHTHTRYTRARARVQAHARNTEGENTKSTTHAHTIHTSARAHTHTHASTVGGKTHTHTHTHTHLEREKEKGRGCTHTHIHSTHTHTHTKAYACVHKQRVHRDVCKACPPRGGLSAFPSPRGDRGTHAQETTSLRTHRVLTTHTQDGDDQDSHPLKLHEKIEYGKHRQNTHWRRIVSHTKQQPPVSL